MDAKARPEGGAADGEAALVDAAVATPDAFSLATEHGERMPGLR
jgi:hypothetical protein